MNTTKSEIYSYALLPKVAKNIWQYYSTSCKSGRSSSREERKTLFFTNRALMNNVVFCIGFLLHHKKFAATQNCQLSWHDIGLKTKMKFICSKMDWKSQRQIECTYNKKKRSKTLEQSLFVFYFVVAHSNSLYAI